MNIGIPLSAHAYTPEAYAYADFLRQRGWQVQLEASLAPDNDINIHFMGVRPFWQNSHGTAIEVHEYQSLSTAPYAHLKDWLKRHVNRSPAARIFLNEFVAQQLHFSDQRPFIYRDMGVDDGLFQQPSAQPNFDILYCGSIANRPGLVTTLLALSRQGYTILVIGSLAPDLEQLFKQHRNITVTGRIPRHELPALYRECAAGLNFTPALYPFQYQTSTKTLEYLASGLQLISNRYPWVEQFCLQHHIPVLWLDDLLVQPRHLSPPTQAIDMHAWRWNTVLQQSRFAEFLQALPDATA